MSRYTAEVSAFAITGSHRGPESSDHPRDLNERLQQKFLLRHENDEGGWGTPGSGGHLSRPADPNEPAAGVAGCSDTS